MKRCAIYTRVSTSMQAKKEFNSCESQANKIRSYVKSQDDFSIIDEFTDAGFTGSNLNRPELHRLFSYVRQQKVDCVLTYKIDRITRSLKDFCNLIEFFDQHKVSLVSVTEHLDTGSASGRLLRNIILTFAQFERELTAERTKDKMIQRAERGLFNGGYTPFGYKRQDKQLIINTKPAKVIRFMFNEVVTTNSSAKVFQWVKQNGVINPHTKKVFTLSAVMHILRNPVYIGKTRWGGKIYDGSHPAIISEELFNHAQGMFGKRPRKKRLYKEYMLLGLVRCAECGSAMTTAFTNKKSKRYHYYKCTKVSKIGREACSIRQVSAERLEEFVADYLSRLSQDPSYIESLAFKTLHEPGYRARLVPSPESSQTLQNILSNRLNKFRQLAFSGSQTDRAVAFQNIIKKIKYHKDSLDVTVSLTGGRPPHGLQSKTPIKDVPLKAISQHALKKEDRTSVTKNLKGKDSHKYFHGTVSRTPQVQSPYLTSFPHPNTPHPVFTPHSKKENSVPEILTRSWRGPNHSPTRTRTWDTVITI